MVIKDLLNKVGAPNNPNDPEVVKLREKLHSLQNQASSTPKPSSSSTPAVASTPAPVAASRAHDQVIADIASASESQQRQFAQSVQPELRVKEERTHRLVAKQVSELIEMNITLQKQVKDLDQEKTTMKQKFEQLEGKNKELNEKMDIIDKRLEKFMGLYEVITNQYNPFVDKQNASSPPPLAAAPVAPTPPVHVSVADSLSGEQAAVPVSQGQMSSENAKKISQLLAELEEQERAKQDANTDELPVIQHAEEELAGKATADISQMLSSFEERLGKLVDEKMQHQLHGTFEKLEKVLNEEIRDAVEEEIGKLKQTDDMLSSAFEELSALEEQSSPQFISAEREIVKDLRVLNDQIKAIPPSLYFRLRDGRVLKSKQDLLLALQTMPPAVFSHHVSLQRNDFADWLSLALKDPSGAHLRGLTRDQMIASLNKQ